VIQKRTGHLVTCLEEIEFEQGIIDREQLLVRARMFEKSPMDRCCFTSRSKAEFIESLHGK